MLLSRLVHFTESVVLLLLLCGSQSNAAPQLQAGYLNGQQEGTVYVCMAL